MAHSEKPDSSCVMLRYKTYRSLCLLRRLGLKLWHISSYFMPHRAQLAIQNIQSTIVKIFIFTNSDYETKSNRAIFFSLFKSFNIRTPLHSIAKQTLCRQWKCVVASRRECIYSWLVSALQEVILQLNAPRAIDANNGYSNLTLKEHRVTRRVSNSKLKYKVTRRSEFGEKDLVPISSSMPGEV